jgi:hypothetical protein
VRYTDPTGHRVDEGCGTEGCELKTAKDYSAYSAATIESRYKSSLRHKGVAANSLVEKIYSGNNPVSRATLLAWATGNVAQGGPNVKLALTDLMLVSMSNLSTGLMAASMGGDLSYGSGSLGNAGAYGDLVKITNTGEVAHHMPQAALGFTSRQEGGALIITQPEHIQTRTYGFRGAITARSDSGMPFRDVLARDIWDIKSINGSNYNTGLHALIEYYFREFPNLIQK